MTIKNTTTEVFSENLLKQRLLNELTQKELGIKSNLGQSTICELELGKYLPRKTTLNQLTDALDINEEQLTEIS